MQIVGQFSICGLFINVTAEREPNYFAIGIKKIDFGNGTDDVLSQLSFIGDNIYILRSKCVTNNYNMKLQRTYLLW